MALAELSSALEECIKVFKDESFPAQLRVQDADEWMALKERLSSSADAAILDWSSHEEGTRAGILRQVVDLGGVLATLAPCAPGTLPHNMGVWQSLVNSTIHYCSTLAHVGGLSGSDLFRWARCGTALFSLGCRVLLSQLEHAWQHIGRGSLADVGGARSTSFVLLGGLLTAASGQVLAARALLNLVWRELRILDAFAASVATPSDVVPWMALVATCINLAHDAGVKVQEESIVVYFPRVCVPMLCTSTFSRHQAALQQAPMHQDPLVKALPHMLLAAHGQISGRSLTGTDSNGADGGGSSRVSAGSSGLRGRAAEWMQAWRVLELIAAPCLKNALQRAFIGTLRISSSSSSGGGGSSGGSASTSSSSSSSGGGQALAQAVVDLVRMVAEQSAPAERSPRERCELAVVAAAGWGQLCSLLSAAAVSGELPDPLKRWAMTEALGMLPVVTRLAEHLQQGQAQLAAAGQPGPAGLAQRQDDGGDDDGGSYASAFMHVAAAVVNMAQHSVGDAIQSCGGDPVHLEPDTLAAVVNAAQASLLLLHFAAGAEPEHRPSTAGNALAACCVEALDEFADVLCSNAHRIGHLEGPDMHRLERPLRQLLFTACRLAHPRAGRGEQWVAPDYWFRILAWLTRLFAACSWIGEGALSTQRRQACAAAYLAAAAAILERCRGGQQLSLWGALDVSYNLQRAMRLCNTWLPGSQLRAPALEALTTICRLVLQWPEEDEEVGVDRTGEVEDLVQGNVGAAVLVPQLAAYLVGSGLMGELLHAGLHPPDGSLPSDEGYAGELQHLLFAMLGALAKAAQEAAEADTSSPAAGLPDDVLAAAVQLSMEAPITFPGAPPVQPAAVLALYTSRLQPLASQLAAALEAHWQQPSQQAAAAVALLQVAATRGCAYLCCSNLGAAGAAAAGPDAGQVPGSKKCSGCRVVRYCDERCSHADWQAGHRRVCKKLTALRLAEAEHRQG